jgi:hypothetical protein
MVQLEQTRTRAKAANKLALDAEKEKDAAEQEVDTGEIVRPSAPPDVSAVKGILSSYSFLFFGTPGHYAMRKYSCWCKACALVRGRGHGCVSRGRFLDVPGCMRSKLTVWKEDQFTVLPGLGIKNREARVAEWVAKALPLVKPGVWGCVQARAQWSTEEDAHMRPGHHWLCEFGDAGNGTSCERQFNLDHRKCEEYRGTRFYSKDSVLVIKRWLNRVQEDASGLTFQEWTPDVDTSRPPVAMLINSSELRAAGFKLREVFPPALEAAARVHARSGTAKS